MDRYRVTAPYVLARTMTPDGPQVKGLYKDSLVPEDASSEWIERHLRKGMIEKLRVAAPAPAQNEEVPSPPPAAPPAGQASDGPQPPPTTGPGSGQQAWVDYAVARGMDRNEALGMKRDDLIAALRED